MGSGCTLGLGQGHEEVEGIFKLRTQTWERVWLHPYLRGLESAHGWGGAQNGAQGLQGVELPAHRGEELGCGNMGGAEREGQDYPPPLWLPPSTPGGRAWWGPS